MHLNHQQIGSPGQTGPSGWSDRPSGSNPALATISSKTIDDEVDDWRKPLTEYLQTPKGTTDRQVRWWTLKFILDNGELYRRTTDDLLLKCLGPDQSRLAMEEVHEGVCGNQ
jgi:hypothetical protein